MPAPPSNPLSMLRRLGTALVGRDGLLTDAASTALGYSPMDRVKNRIAAQTEVQKQMEFKNKLDEVSRKTDADNLELETNRYNLNRSRLTDTRTDTERDAEGRVLAGSVGVGPPNPDGSSVVGPDTARGMVRGQTTLQTLKKSRGLETMTPALHNEMTKAGMNPGVEIGGEFDTSQMDRAISMRNFNEGIQARLQVARESAAARHDAATVRRGFQKDSIVGRISTALQSNDAYKKYVSVRAESSGLKSLLQNAINDPNGTSDIAIINMFQRLADPGVAVREGDVALIQSAQGVVPRIANLEAWISEGNRLTPETRANMLTLIDPIVEARASAARETAQPFRNRVRANQIDEDEVFPEGFFPLDAEQVAPPAPRPPAPTPALGSRLQSLRKKFLNQP